MKRNLSILVLLLTMFLVAMAATAAPAYKFEDVVSNTRGDVIGGATVSVYIAGTDSLASLYSGSSASAGTAKANPTYTDVYGRFLFYAASGGYDVTISGSGITTYTLSDVTVNSPGDIFDGDAPYFTSVTFIPGDTTAVDSTGTVFYDSDNDAMKLYDGTDWGSFPSVRFGATAPTDTTGRRGSLFWFDPTGGDTLKVYTGTADWRWKALH